VPYKQIQCLGEGFFGKVWLEQDLGLNRPCAAKHLDPTYFSKRTNVFAEAQTMRAAGENDFVVTVYSAELENNEPVIRMEYLPNGSVDDKHNGSPVPVDEAVRIMEDACRGISHLHALGILHRDIKPANLLVADSGRVKVSDFGLACELANASTAPPRSYPMHLPPESAATGTGITTVAGDIYAAGVTAYRLLNGDQTLRAVIQSGADVRDLIAKGKYPDRSQWLHHVHKPLRQVIKRAMHIDPNKRYADAGKFRRALEQARPKVSWWPGLPVNGLSWEGVAIDGTAEFRAVVEPTRRGFRFNVERRLSGRAWRSFAADAFSATTEAEVIAHAQNVLGRIAIKAH
jgi:eukaryotic-like serine/threonine-protein kinase